LNQLSRWEAGWPPAIKSRTDHNGACDLRSSPDGVS
jgi:hypothetical protein